MLSVVPLDVIDVVDVRGVLGCCWRVWFVFLVSVGTIGDANGLGLAPVDYEELCGPMYRMYRHPGGVDWMHLESADVVLWVKLGVLWSPWNSYRLKFLS